MASKRTTMIEKYLLGVDQTITPNEGLRGPSSPRGLYWLSNVRLHPANYYINDRGWEAQKVFDDSSYKYTSGDFEPTRFLDVWERHDGSEKYYFYERDGQLVCEWGNGLASNTRCILRNTGFRHLPQPTEPGTQMTAVGGKWCLFSNGHDEPFKFFKSAAAPGTIDTQFSWSVRPPPPQPIPIETTYATSSSPAQDLGVFVEATAAVIPGSGIYGITQEDETGNISYAYKVRWFSDTGSVSPLSDAATLDFSVATANKARYIAWIRVGQGPDNAIGFDLFRTQQLGRSSRNAGTISNDFFFVKRVYGNASQLVSDHMPDSLLTIKAPSPIEDAVPIDPTFNYSAVWDDRVWIAGGPVYAAQVRFSAASQPETFPQLNYFNYTGGNVTALVDYNSYLFVFQRNAINVITNDSGVYKTSRITSEIGTTATNTIKAVPGGLIFLAADGFYMISEGSRTFQVQKISQPIEPVFDRLNKQSMPRATAVYNPIEKEYWCHMPVDGKTENTFGCVLHHNGEWSFREDPDSTVSSMTFPHLAFDGAHTIIGPYPIDTLNEAAIEDGEWINLGLQVWSASPAFGSKHISGSVTEGSYTFTRSTNTRVASVVETIWVPMADEYAKKQPFSIQFHALGTGYQMITPTYYYDYQWSTGEAISSIPLQDPDYMNSTSASPVFGEVTYDPVGIWDTSVGGELRPIVLRWDINPRNSRTFKLKWSSSDLFAIKSFTIDFEPTAMPITNAANR